jgi:hypothetical protein
MAINVDLVYKTVLLILNKEQRGYVTPEEFNKIGTQVQLEIFETYFDDLNQQLRIPSNESEYADRQKNIDDKISIFKTIGACTRTSPNIWFVATVKYASSRNRYIQRNEQNYKERKRMIYCT